MAGNSQKDAKIRFYQGFAPSQYLQFYFEFDIKQKLCFFPKSMQNWILDKCMRRYCINIQNLLGDGVNTPNLHLVSHLHLYAKWFGPLTQQSCFVFESYNRFTVQCKEGRGVLSRHCGSIVSGGRTYLLIEIKIILYWSTAR